MLNTLHFLVCALFLFAILPASAEVKEVKVGFNEYNSSNPADETAVTFSFVEETAQDGSSTVTYSGPLAETFGASQLLFYAGITPPEGVAKFDIEIAKDHLSLKITYLYRAPELDTSFFTAFTHGDSVTVIAANIIGKVFGKGLLDRVADYYESEGKTLVLPAQD